MTVFLKLNILLNRSNLHTLIKLAHRIHPLLRILLLHKLLIRLVRLDVIPRIVIKDIIALFQVPRPKLKGIRTFLRIVRGICPRLAHGLEVCGYTVGIGFARGRGCGGFGDGDGAAQVLHAGFELLAFGALRGFVGVHFGILRKLRGKFACHKNLPDFSPTLEYR